mgnify:CR=1 FL=1
MRLAELPHFAVDSFSYVFDDAAVLISLLVNNSDLLFAKRNPMLP